jgi:hypothetical protein
MEAGMETDAASKPNPAQLAKVLAGRQTVYPTPATKPIAVPQGDGVIFAYIDNSNVWIEGQRIQTVKQGKAKNVYEAGRDGAFLSSWSYDFGRLYELACPVGANVGRSMLVGSRPPPNDSVWQRARDEGFEVEVFSRNIANREKQVDSMIVTTMMADSYEYMKPERGDIAVLVAGDADYLPSMRRLQSRGLGLRVLFWRHATSAELRETATEFIELDPYFEWLTYGAGAA